MRKKKGIKPLYPIPIGFTSQLGIYKKTNFKIFNFCFVVEKQIFVRKKIKVSQSKPYVSMYKVVKLYLAMM